MKRAVGCLESTAYPLAPLGFLWSSHLTHQCTGLQKAIHLLLDHECHLVCASTESSSLSVLLLQQTEANEAGCVSYADPYKALYGFHSGQ